MNTFTLEKQTMDLRCLHIDGNTLDFSGGGEGIITCRSGIRVVAIDKRLGSVGSGGQSADLYAGFAKKPDLFKRACKKPDLHSRCAY